MSVQMSQSNRRRTACASGLLAAVCFGLFGSVGFADVLIGVSSGGTSVLRYDATAKILVASPVASGLGTQIYDIGALSNGDALIGSDGAGGKVVLYSGITQTTGAALMTATGAISRMAEVSAGDALIPISSGEVYRYDAASESVPGPAVASGLGTFYDNRGLSNGDALIASSASSGNVVRYNGTTKTVGGYLMTFTGAISPITEVSGGDALAPISDGGQVWRYDAATQTVPSMVASGLGSFYDTLGLTNGDALIASSASSGNVVRYNGTTKTVGGYLMSFTGAISRMVEVSGGDALVPISGGQVWRYDAATQSVPGPAVATGLGNFFDTESLANGDALIATDASGGSLFRYDGASKTTGGALMTFAGTINDVIGLPDGDALIYATGAGGSLWRYDAATQSVLGTPLGTSLGSYFDAESVVPEPSALSLLCVGLIALCRRK